MTLFTDNPFEKMMIQRPGGRRDNAPPVPHFPGLRFPVLYKNSSSCAGYTVRNRIPGGGK